MKSSKELLVCISQVIFERKIDYPFKLIIVLKNEKIFSYTSHINIVLPVTHSFHDNNFKIIKQIQIFLHVIVYSLHVHYFS